MGMIEKDTPKIFQTEQACLSRNDENENGYQRHFNVLTNSTNLITLFF
jgi:hypothetical protein